MTDDELDRWLALYADCCEQSGIEPLPDDEARALARQFHDLRPRQDGFRAFDRTTPLERCRAQSLACDVVPEIMATLPGLGVGLARSARLGGRMQVRHVRGAEMRHLAHR